MAVKSVAALVPIANRLSPMCSRRGARLSGACVFSSCTNASCVYAGMDLSRLHASSFHASARSSERETDKVFQKMMASENRTIEISKLINPRDANPVGAMHGGNVLSLLEEAGIIAATRHINSHRDTALPPCVAALARMEKVDFRLPIRVGDVVEVDSEVTFTSEHSCEVCVTIEKMSTMKGNMERKLATTAYLWFVPVYQDPETGDQKTASMPPLQGLTAEQQSVRRARYETQVASRSSYHPAHKQLPIFMATARGLFPKGTVRNSQLMMTHFVNVTDCDMFRQMRGGSLMKLADEACGSSAYLHAESICVTASVDACNFRVPIPAGSSVFLDSYVTFTSDKSMEIEVVVHHAQLNHKTLDVDIHNNSFNALYTFIPIDMEGKAKPVRPLILETDLEREVFEKGRQRYEQRRKQRLKNP